MATDNTETDMRLGRRSSTYTLLTDGLGTKIKVPR